MPRQFADQTVNAAKKRFAIRHPLRFMIVTAVILIMALAILPGYIATVVDATARLYDVFWTLFVRWAMFFSAFVLAFLFLWINLRHAATITADFKPDNEAERPGYWSRRNAVTRSGFKFAPKFVMLDIVLASAGVAWCLGQASTPNGHISPLSLRPALWRFGPTL